MLFIAEEISENHKIYFVNDADGKQLQIGIVDGERSGRYDIGVMSLLQRR